MKTYTYILSLLILQIILLQNISFCQDGKPVRLLQDWFGIWEGYLEIKQVSGNGSVIPMRLEIRQTDTAGVWTWTINYNTGDSAEHRNYFLRKIDSEKGTYILDQRDSDMLDFYLSGKTFLSTYSRSGNLICEKYVQKDSTIIFEMTSSDMGNSNISGTSKDEKDFTYSYPVTIFQRAILNKFRP